MTVTFGFYNSVDGDRVYSADEFGSLFDGIIIDGIFESVGDAFNVTEQTGSNMNILVGSGRCWFDRTWLYNSASLILTVSTSNPVLDRIDTVVIEVDSDNAVRTNSIKILTGTADATPVPPTLTDTATKHQYRLADIYVTAAVTAITDDDITNFIGVDGGTPFAKTLGSTGGSGGGFGGLGIIDQSGGTGDTFGVLGGTINGSNQTFTVSNGSYVSGTLKVWLNGQLQTQGTGEDYVELVPASGTFQFATAPIVGDEISVEYLTITPTDPSAGWYPYSAIIPTRVVSADPTYTLQFASIDLTGLFERGMPIKWTQNSIVRYGWISGVPSYSGGNTTITVLTRTDDASGDHDVLDTSTYPISQLHYGMKKTCPFGMPGDPSNWDFVVTNSTLYTKTSPTTGVWYNAMDSGNLPSANIPIGLWEVSYNALCRVQTSASPQYAKIAATLSTSAGSESDVDFSAAATIGADWVAVSGLLLTLLPLRAFPKVLSLAAMTTYYLNLQGTCNTTVDSIQVQGHISTTVIKARCLFL